MTLADPALTLDVPDLLAELRRRHRLPDEEALREILPAARLEDGQRSWAERQARGWIEVIRKEKSTMGGVSDFLQEFKLSTTEGVALLCVAEALLRIPDAATADALIRDKLTGIDWAAHEKRTGSLFANASVWGLWLTGTVLGEPEQKGLMGSLKGLLSRAGQPVIRTAMTRAMGLLGDQFVLGRSIGEALERASEAERKGYRHSYDMLGEGARTAEDAERYYKSYENAIIAIGKSREQGGDVFAAPGISVKLSALHARFTESQRDLCVPQLTDKLVALCEAAAHAGIGLTVDAEESERLEAWLEIVQQALASQVTKNWNGMGIAVQAYQKRAPQVIDMVSTICRAHDRQMMVRLVKGAYWDSEIKRAQMNGLPDYPVYTRKTATDVSYLACARRLLGQAGRIYPAFGTHNAFTMASIMAVAPKDAQFEFQRLHGMGAELHDQVVAQGRPSRIYAPVGGHQDLLAYLVRRILENGANSSFVQRLRDGHVPIAALVHDPEVELIAMTSKRNPAIVLPKDIFARENRANSAGIDMDSRAVTDPLLEQIGKFTSWQASSLIAGQPQSGTLRQVASPADHRQIIGQVTEASSEQVSKAIELAQKAQPDWASRSVKERANCLRKAADLFESHRAELMALIGLEGGRILRNAMNEVREAVDLCRYYAMCAELDLQPHHLPGYTGERNELRLVPRGLVAAISPWNFPLAIFVGQIVAPLVAGNAVLAKPAGQTPLIAYKAVELLHEAGVPGDVLALLLGGGSTVGAQLINDPRIGAVVFTGSTEVGRKINQQLAAREGPIVPLIAETGGLNALIVDSTALPEQVCDDVLLSAFDSAGQRCSSLRVLFVQEDVAPKMIDMITGALEGLRLGHPLKLSTDIGPVIDNGAKKDLIAHAERMKAGGELLYSANLPEECVHGSFLAPMVFEIPRIDLLTREAFGPILHIVRWQGDRIEDVVNAIKASGYGLTGGVHSRRDGFARELAAQLPIGNFYINRNLVGAIPGVQPFGGEGLSGTGPKAGGPHYVRRFTTERVITTDTTAAGGNASLLMLAD
jgi:RHH-type transcriptional regulator, proline utilization regulon repressor / proline dehydrogenase / delta 1-pyrroline-5-carboxylate dehydrogenase